jgi:hypothetical protein
MLITGITKTSNSSFSQVSSLYACFDMRMYCHDMTIEDTADQGSNPWSIHLEVKAQG